jgi:hypothetical protein
MQVEPKKTNRPLPHGWKEKGLKKQLRAVYDSIFGDSTDENGTLKVNK